MCLGEEEKEDIISKCFFLKRDDIDSIYVLPNEKLTLVTTKNQRDFAWIDGNRVRKLQLRCDDDIYMIKSRFPVCIGSGMILDRTEDHYGLLLNGKTVLHDELLIPYAITPFPERDGPTTKCVFIYVIGLRGSFTLFVYLSTIDIQHNTITIDETFPICNSVKVKSRDIVTVWHESVRNSYAVRDAGLDFLAEQLTMIYAPPKDVQLGLPRHICSACLCLMDAETWTYDCPKGHVACGSCAVTAARVRLEGGRLPNCTACADRYELDDFAFVSLLTAPFVTEEERTALHESNQRRLQRAHPNWISCPRDGCDGLGPPMSSNDSSCRICDRCNYTFCAKCREIPHPWSLTCDLDFLRASWLLWNNDSINKETLVRTQDTKADEAYKKAHCRMCPSCQRVIERSYGCDSMVCGRDADARSDGSSVGCGQNFLWTKAPPYSSHHSTFSIEIVHREVCKAKAEVDAFERHRASKVSRFRNFVSSRFFCGQVVVSLPTFMCTVCFVNDTRIMAICVHCGTGGGFMCLPCAKIHNPEHVLRIIHRIDESDDSDLPLQLRDALQSY